MIFNTKNLTHHIEEIRVSLISDDLEMRKNSSEMLASEPFLPTFDFRQLMSS